MKLAKTKKVAQESEESKIERGVREKLRTELVLQQCKKGIAARDIPPGRFASAISECRYRKYE